MVPSQDARTAAASIALHAATAATHAGCIAVYIADWRRFLWRQQLTGAGAEQQHHEQQQQPRTQNPQQPHAHDASSNADKKITAVEDT